jgi:hypothetical protein
VQLPPARRQARAVRRERQAPDRPELVRQDVARTVVPIAQRSTSRSARQAGPIVYKMPDCLVPPMSSPSPTRPGGWCPTWPAPLASSRSVHARRLDVFRKAHR